IVQGRLKQRSYEDREGVKRTVYELDVEEVGAALSNATAKLTKANRSGAGGPSRTDDRWNTGGATTVGGDNVPF
ncbi:single-stranded DNA-binding protein, partial [Streptomyces noursei]